LFDDVRAANMAAVIAPQKSACRFWEPRVT
jgi:hypothetical protein